MSARNYFTADVISYSDYYPFGMLMPNRHGQDEDYRYGFNGMESDDEVYGSKGTAVNYKYRMHNPRIGRFFAVDPLAFEFPWNSPYAFSENRVIDALELEGLEAWVSSYEAADVMTFYDYSRFAQQKTLEMTQADDVAENKFDCADFVITTLIFYYKEKGVAFQFKIGGKTFDSNDPKYSGESAFDDFVEDVKLHTSADNLRNKEVTFEISDNNMRPGDIISNGGHSAIYLGTDENGKVNTVQASGAYYGKGKENYVMLPEMAPQNSIWGQGYRWNFPEGVSMGSESGIILEKIEINASEKLQELINSNNAIPETLSTPKHLQMGPFPDDEFYEEN